ncbi:MAG: hypothetical protein V1866_03170 [archaeon]
MASKKADRKSNNLMIVAIVAIVAIVGMVFMFSKMVESNGLRSSHPEFKVAIDEQGNLYDGDFNLVGQLADKNMEFYDANGNMIGFAQISLADDVIVEADENMIGNAASSCQGWWDLSNEGYTEQYAKYAPTRCGAAPARVYYKYE